MAKIVSIGNPFKPKKVPLWKNEVYLEELEKQIVADHNRKIREQKEARERSQ
ncbi:hypothetical protein KZP23_07540 [Echinicola marina]|uniref:hypothetical protein n=1 Tax=Echinicola marina TaxID=2859768 RepID=UPI001CF67F96|nr:hypothetical protein [Echinicola marina]UCS94853.1 hypothetical protein KZP23_07540 [Echinicola marina]